MDLSDRTTSLSRILDPVVFDDYFSHPAHIANHNRYTATMQFTPSSVAFEPIRFVGRSAALPHCDLGGDAQRHPSHPPYAWREQMPRTIPPRLDIEIQFQ